MLYVLIATGLVLGYVVLVYNGLISLREAVYNEAKQIDIQLDRRYKIYESLISAVAKYLNYEETVLNHVVALRAQAKSAQDSGDEANRMASENAISKVASGLNVMVEAYPDLKGNTTVLNLMEEISSTENKLSFAKQAYNDASERFNAKIQSFPVNLLVSMFGFEKFTYWQLSSEDAKSKEDYTVKL